MRNSNCVFLVHEYIFTTNIKFSNFKIQKMSNPFESIADPHDCTIYYFSTLSTYQALSNWYTLTPIDEFVVGSLVVERQKRISPHRSCIHIEKDLDS